MRRLNLILLAPILASASFAQPQTIQTSPNFTNECSAAANINIADVKITNATPTSGGIAWAMGLNIANPTNTNKPFCKISGTIENTIGFEIWLPAQENWNGKFLGAGVGGAAGTFNFQDLPRGINRGYAAATTDTGHKMADGVWMLNPIARENYTHRANHLLAIKGKQIVSSFYGQLPTKSYFIGCSGGGRQGLKELQLYPEDYDGIISGANGPKTPEMTVRRMWEILQRDANPNLMSRENWQLVADKGNEACDISDGVQDGLVQDPRVCRFQLSSLACKNGQTTNCLSPQQVQFASRFYAPLRDENGRAIDGGILPGVLIDNGRSQLALGTFGQAIRGLQNWNGAGFSVKNDLAAIDRVMPQLRADTANISAFRDRGGKIIQYTGWLDGAVATRMVIDYQNQLIRTMGGATELAKFERMYLLPGVYHCRGGPGPDMIGGAGADGYSKDAQHDMLTALENWVENGVAPNTMIAAKVENGNLVRTGLICPYPLVAKYKGGDFNNAASFTCQRGR